MKTKTISDQQTIICNLITGILLKKQVFLKITFDSQRWCEEFNKLYILNIKMLRRL